MQLLRCLPCTLVPGLLATRAPAQARPSPTPPAVLARTLPPQQVLDDLALFQRIKESAHAGIYKYRSKVQMDSAFAAARRQVSGPLTVLQAYRLVAGITDFEGSLHNDTFLPDSVQRALHRQAAFFPYPVKVIEGRLLLDYAGGEWPAGTEILGVNDVPTPQLMRALGRYYTTDGFNQTGKEIGINRLFAQLLCYAYGPQRAFAVVARPPGTAAPQVRQLEAVTYQTAAQRRGRRHSRSLDSLATPPGKHHYGLRVLGPTAVLTVRTLNIGGNANAKAHKAYRQFLDSCFTAIRANPAVKSVLVDVRGNGGGTDPNDLLTFSYLAQRPFQENKSAAVLFQQIPYAQHAQPNLQGPLRWLTKTLGQRALRRGFALGPDGRYYQRAKDRKTYAPNPLRTDKPVCLLVDGRVASAASLFAALVRGNTNAVVVGEETMGGYYGHTGHVPITYRLPHTGISTQFSLVDVAQDVPVRASQPPGRGILPDYIVTQSTADFLANRDTQLAFALRLLAAQAGERKNEE